MKMVSKALNVCPAQHTMGWDLWQRMEWWTTPFMMMELQARLADVVSRDILEVSVSLVQIIRGNPFEEEDGTD